VGGDPGLRDTRLALPEQKRMIAHLDRRL
jgi:hypothetical protein